MDQLLLLLRARCAYCSHLKLRPVDVDRFICKLRLLQYGLIQQTQDLENVQHETKFSKTIISDGVSVNEALESDESDEDEDSLIKRRNSFVEHAISQASESQNSSIYEAGKVEAIAEERRATIKELLASAGKTQNCGRCKGFGRPHSASYRNLG